MTVYGSDVVVQTLIDLGIEVVTLNPGASIRGFHDSLVHRQDSGGPLLVTCLHEEIAVAAAHGYAKAAGKPMAVGIHNIVGLHHASMGLFNAWCDRVPILAVGGTGPVAADRRRPWIEWIHTANVQGNLVRDYVKWDDQPTSVPAAVEALVRGYAYACNPPAAPVYVCLPVEIQEDPWTESIPAIQPRVMGRAAPDPHAVVDAAELLAGAERPVIVTDRAADSPGGPAALVALAELLGAAVIDRGARMNMSNTHPLDLTGLEREVIGEADVVLAVELVDLHGTLRLGEFSGTRRPAVIEVSQAGNLISSWAADYQALAPVDIVIPADAALSLEAIAEECRGRVDKSQVEGRWDEYRRRHDDARDEWEAHARSTADDVPITTAGIALALREMLGERPFVLSNGTLNGWARKLWRWEGERVHLGGNGGGGIGYGVGASVGVGIAEKESGRLVLNLQPDGDLLYAPSALWSMANQRLPILTVVWNNRSYQNTLEHARRMADWRDREHRDGGLGNMIDDPAVSFTDLARAFGIWANRRVEEPEHLTRSLKEAFEVIEGGEPALVEVVAAAR